MDIVFAPRGILQIDGARIVWRNFKGEGSMYNKAGDRNFNLVIPDAELAERLQNDTNEYGVGWKVKIKAPRDESESPFYYMPVNVKYSDNSKPVIFVVVNEGTRNEKRIRLDEDTVGMLDDISIERVDLDIRPYDGESSFGPFRSAYLQSMCVFQRSDLDRFSARFAEEDEEEYMED